MTDGWKSAERSQDIRAVMLRLSDLFSPTSGGQVIFRLFGPYEGVPNLLFTVIFIFSRYCHGKPIDSRCSF